MGVIEYSTQHRCVLCTGADYGVQIGRPCWFCRAHIIAVNNAREWPGFLVHSNKLLACLLAHGLCLSGSLRVGISQTCPLSMRHEKTYSFHNYFSLKKVWANNNNATTLQLPKGGKQAHYELESAKPAHFLLRYMKKKLIYFIIIFP